jgi:hypothetical protein
MTRIKRNSNNKTRRSSGQIEALLSHKSAEAEKNRSAVLSCVKELVKASASGIVNLLEKKADEYNKNLSQTTQERYERGDLSRRETDDFISGHSISAPDIRTVQRWLKQLKEQGLVEYSNRRYSLTDKAQDVKYWADKFGISALANIMRSHFPTVYRFDANLDILIELIGTYVVYAFTEAARPVKDYGFPMSLAEKDKICKSWIQHVFPIWDMYNYFLAAIKYHPGDKHVDDYVETNYKDHGDGTGEFVDDNGESARLPTTSDLRFKLWLFVVSKDAMYSKLVKPIYELDEEKIEAIDESLKRRNRFFYNALTAARNQFQGGPKDGSLPEVRKLYEGARASAYRDAMARRKA